MRWHHRWIAYLQSAPSKNWKLCQDKIRIKNTIGQEGRSQEGKRNKDAEHTDLHVLVWEGGGTRGKKRANQSCR